MRAGTSWAWCAVRGVSSFVTSKQENSAHFGRAYLGNLEGGTDLTCVQQLARVHVIFGNHHHTGLAFRLKQVEPLSSKNQCCLLVYLVQADERTPSPVVYC